MDTAYQIKSAVKPLGPLSHKTNLYDPNIQGTSKSYFILKNFRPKNVRLYAFTTGIKIEFPLQTSLLFSIGIPDVICCLKKPFLYSTIPDQVYTNGSMDQLVVECLDLIKQEIIALRLQKGEAMLVYQNSLQLYIINIDRNYYPSYPFC